MGDSFYGAEYEKESGNVAYRLKDFETALMHYKEAVRLNPNDIVYRNNMAAVFFEQRLYDKCIEECKASVVIGRKKRADSRHISKALSRIGHSYLRKNDLKNSLEFYRQSLQEFHNVETLTRIQELEQQLNTHVEVETLKAAGDELFNRGDFPNALTKYTEAIKVNSMDSDLYSRRADCYAKLLEFKAAAGDCDSCLAIQPCHVKALVRRGNCFLALREYEVADQDFMAALDIEQNCREALEGVKRCATRIKLDPEVVRQQAMRNPEIQRILQVPIMKKILNSLPENSSLIKEHLNDPVIAKMVGKLIEQGLIAIR